MYSIGFNFLFHLCLNVSNECGVDDIGLFAEDDGQSFILMRWIGNILYSDVGVDPIFKRLILVRCLIADGYAF